MSTMSSSRSLPPLPYAAAAPFAAGAGAGAGAVAGGSSRTSDVGVGVWMVGEHARAAVCVKWRAQKAVGRWRQNELRDSNPRKIQAIRMR